MYKVYILQSASSRHFYCGHTDDLVRRLAEHNDPEYRGSLTTKRFTGPWEVVWSEPHVTRAAAIRRERQIKRRGIGRFLAERAE